VCYYYSVLILFSMYTTLYYDLYYVALCFDACVSPSEHQSACLLTQLSVKCADFLTNQLSVFSMEQYPS
jgi:hypothetical protein